MQLKATHKEEGKVQLGLYTWVKNDATGGLPVAVRCKLCAQKAGNGARSYSIQTRTTNRYISSKNWGLTDFFEKGPISSIDQLSKFIIDGKLKLRCTLVKVDGRQLV